MTNEDRAFCEVVWAALKGDHNDLRRERMILHAHRDFRQAAFNAGLERAAVILDDEARHMAGLRECVMFDRLATAIRAEKDKT